MEEKVSPVFVLATANDVSALPAELLRKGRFDELFFVDLPSEEERRGIFAIHLRKRSRDPRQFDTASLAKASELFSGAEIEAAVIAACSKRSIPARKSRPRILVRRCVQRRRWR